ncbi:MAG: hypothetical protein L3J21_04235 [Devosiaceae bacterium]|nr:hypothetical protein [Devosiaceae bacterium]
MSIPILAASALSFLTLIAHIFGGYPEIMVPVLASELTPYLKAIMVVIWDAVTVIITINSLALLYAAIKPQHRSVLVTLVSAQYLLWGGLFVYYGLTMLGSLWPMPQWIAFFLIPALAIFGLWLDKKRTK